jgi:hypothetical protein
MLVNVLLIYFGMAILVFHVHQNKYGILLLDSAVVPYPINFGTVIDAKMQIVGLIKFSIPSLCNVNAHQILT